MPWSPGAEPRTRTFRATPTQSDSGALSGVEGPDAKLKGPSEQLLELWEGSSGMIAFHGPHELHGAEHDIGAHIGFYST